MLRIEELVDWLAARLVATEVRYNVMPDENPARMVVLNEMPGLRSELQDALDNPVVKIRSRGATATDARDLAHRVDRALVDARRPFAFGGLYVVTLGRLGGPPWPTGVDRMERTHYECNYWFSVAR